MFYYDSYSCRIGKGTHKRVKRLERLVRKVSKNYTKPCWALKCDIKKYFHNIDHKILFSLLKRKIRDRDILWLLSQVINSFHSEFGKEKGAPLGNLTSQIFANIYLNEFDQFVKHNLKIKHYLRYADDFLILCSNKDELTQYIKVFDSFLKDNLKLELHPRKIILRKLSHGIDFLGYIVLPYYVLPRTRTKRRTFKKIKLKIHEESFNQTLQSYLGFLSHAASYNLSKELKNIAWFL